MLKKIINILSEWISCQGDGSGGNVLPPGPRQTVVLERTEKKSLPGRESFSSYLKREAGAAKARNEPAVIGVSPFT